MERSAKGNQGAKENYFPCWCSPLNCHSSLIACTSRNIGNTGFASGQIETEAQNLGLKV